MSFSPSPRLQAPRASLLALIITASFAFTACAQITSRNVNQYRRSTWQPEQNSTSESIQSIAQTPDGYLWIATKSNLLRFDGLRFKPLLTPEQEPLKRVLSLSVDRAGTLWFRTRDARLMQIVNGTPAAVSFAGQQDRGIAAMTAADGGGLYATSINKDTLLLSGTDARKIPLHSKSLLISIAETSDHKVWAGTRDQGLLVYDGTSTRPVPSPGMDRKVNCLLPTGAGGMWIGTDDGLAFWDGAQVTPRPLNGPGMLHLQVLTLLEDRAGDLWAGTSRGLLRYSAQGAQWLSVPHPGTSAVTALIQDREGDIWFGNGALLERLQATALIHVPEAAELKPSALYSDAKGRTWLAGRDGGLSWLDATGLHAVTIDELDKDVVYSIDGRGDDIWLGRRDHGLTRMHSTGNLLKATTWTTKDGLAENHIFSVRVAADGSVWAGTLTSGVSRFAAGRFTTLAEQQGLPSAAVNVLEPDTTGRMWIGTPNGLCIVITDKPNRCTPPQAVLPPASKEVLSLLSDPAGGMLVGTRTGLLHVAAGKVSPIAFSDPSPHSILGMAFDARQTLWLSTNRGILSVPRDHPGPPLAERTYSADDGVTPGDPIARSRSVTSGNNGAVWIATSAALYLTAADELSPTPAIPHIESIAVNGQPASVANASVHPGANRLSFTFSGLNLRAPDRVRLRYRLQGFDQQWIDAQDDRQASYTNLPPGHYSFHLIAASVPGQWNRDETLAAITVLPFYWQRTWVQLTTAAALALCLLGLYHLRTRQLLTRANLLSEERLRERTRIARDLHDTLLQGFISSVMHLHVASQVLPPESPLRSTISPALDVMERVIEEARIAVVELRAPEADALQLSSEMTEFVGSLSYPRHMSIDVCVSGRERTLPPLVFEEVRRTLQEALQNAVRHSGAGQVSVSLRYGRLFFHARVHDDGCGIPAGLRKARRSGHWGLAGMRERTQRIHARFRIVSKPGQGTTVTLRLLSIRAYRRDSQLASGTSISL